MAAATDGGEQLGGGLDVGGGLLDGAAGSCVSSLSFFQSLFHFLCRVLRIRRLLTNKNRKVCLMSM